MSGGWVCYPRKIQDSFLYPRRRAFTSLEAYTDLRLSVAYRSHDEAIKGLLKAIRRGQLLTSQVQLAKRWGWGRDRVARFLRLCQEDGLFDFETHLDIQAGYTLITFLDYDPPQSTGFPSDEFQKRGTGISGVLQKWGTKSSSERLLNQGSLQSMGEALNKEGNQGNEKHIERHVISPADGKQDEDGEIWLPDPFLSRPDAPEVEKLLENVSDEERSEILDSITSRLSGITNLPAYLRSVIRRRKEVHGRVEEGSLEPTQNEPPIPKSICCGQLVVFDVARGANVCGTCREING